MEDVITEIPPPSRFFEADLNNFTSPSPPLLSPFLLFPQPHQQPLRPSLLIIALSSPSLHLFHNFPSKILIGSLVLPEVPFSGNSVKPSLADNSGTIYALCDGDSWNSTVLVSVQCPVAAERSHSVAKLLIGDRIIPQRVLVLDSVRSQNYRGWLALFQAFALKLESSAERKMEIGRKLLKGLEYYPSGSVVDGLGAALLARCQLLNIRGSLYVSWPEFDASVVSLMKGLLESDVLPGLELNLSGGKSYQLSLNNLFEPDLYT